MQVLEKVIESKFVRWCKANGVKLKKKMPGDQLDRWVMLPGGKPFIIEFKKPGHKTTPLQQHEIDQLKDLGYDVEVHYAADTAIAAVHNRLTAISAHTLEARKRPTKGS